MSVVTTQDQIIQISGVSRRYGDVTAVADIDLVFERNKIYGLLGRNGAGKTTLMQLLTGQDFPSSGQVRIFGENPAENPAVLQNLCFIKESQRYPDSFHARHVLAAAPWFYPNWDEDYAQSLVKDFKLPMKRAIKKMSRGQQSALGVILGLASRAPITFFDEPYLGLDPVARQLFYDRLLEDYAEYPRTVILSTHLIDEVSNLLEHVVVINEGEIIINAPAEEVRGTATAVAGKVSAAEEFTAGREILHRQQLGGLVSITVQGKLSAEEKAQAQAAGLELSPVSLQQLIVHATTSKSEGLN